MKQINISAPSKLYTSTALPASKSICNRALIINALSTHSIYPENLSDCDDTDVIVKALKNMTYTIDIKAAGTAMRFLTSYLAVGKEQHVITGTERMKQRPISILVNALRLLGANIEYTEQEGFPPLKISGKTLTGGKIELKGNVSSQYISSLLLIAPTLKEGLQIRLTGEVVSVPYINMTLRLMNEFGAQAAWTSEKEIKVWPKPYKAIPYTIENDWSAASYWYEMAALADDAEIELPGLLPNSLQGDSQVARLFHYLGVTTEYTGTGIIIRNGGERVKRLNYNFVNEPDLAQTFVVTCCLQNIAFRFTGLQSLKIKETDRMAALINEMKKLGYVVNESDDAVLEWNGERCEPDAAIAIDTYEDHRMAMAFAPAAIRIKGIGIRHPEVVSKSYPGYWNELKKCGFELKE